MRNICLMAILAMAFILITAAIYQITNYNHLNTIGELVFNKRIIHSISIYKGQNSSPSLVISNHIEIKKILEKIYDIKVKKLSKEEDVSFMANGNRMLQEDLLSIQFYDNSEKIGQFLIWSDGSIYIIDIKSMVSPKRTNSYKSEMLHPEIYAIFK